MNTGKGKGSFMQEGLILKGIGGFYYVKSGGKIYECKPRGILKKDGKILAVGDKVQISITNEEKSEGIIERYEPRKNYLIRPPVSNIGQIIIVIAVKSPLPDLFLLDKLLIRSNELQITPVICINKIDLCEDREGLYKEYQKAGYKVVYVSAVNNIGIDNLKANLKGKISILAGQSGVGKSTIINCLNINKKAEVGDVSKKINRGKHTTRHVELFKIDEESYIADAPGFSSFDISNIESKNLKDYYPEFNQYMGQCRFNGCCHDSEPECAVKAAFEEGSIDPGRLERYREFFNVLKQKERFK